MKRIFSALFFLVAAAYAVDIFLLGGARVYGERDSIIWLMPVVKIITLLLCLFFGAKLSGGRLSRFLLGNNDGSRSDPNPNVWGIDRKQERVEPQFSKGYNHSNRNQSDHKPQHREQTLHVFGPSWRLTNGTLCTTYEYHHLTPSPVVHRLQIDIDRSDSVFQGYWHYHVNLFLNPHPWPDAGDVICKAQLSTVLSENKIPFFNVLCSKAADDSLLISLVSRGSIDTFIAVIRQNLPMIFILMQEDEILLRLPIPNDSSFIPVARKFFDETS